MESGSCNSIVDHHVEFDTKAGLFLGTKGAFTPKAKLFFASPKTREFTRSTIRRVQAMSVETLREGRGLSLCLISVKTAIISFIHQNN